MKLSIRDYKVPVNSHDMYDVVVDDVKIETLVTHDPAKLISWINGIEDLHRCRLDRLIVGLDIEWCPHFLPGDHSVATLQLCVGKSCLVYQILRAPNIPRRLRQFLEDSDYTFVGVGIDGDVKKLDTDYDLGVEKTKDLRSWAADELGKNWLRSVGLKALVKEVVGKDLDKPDGVRLSRWDNHRLSEPQVMYACLDAYFSFEIGRRLSAWY